MVTKVKVPGPDPELVKLQKDDAMRSQAARVDAIQGSLRGQTARTKRRFGIFSMLDGLFGGGGQASAPSPGGGNGYGGNPGSGSSPLPGGGGNGPPQNPSF